MSYNYASNNIIKEWLSSARASLSAEEDSERMADQHDHHLNELKANNAISYGILQEIKSLNYIEEQKLEELQKLNNQAFINNLACSCILLGITFILNKIDK